MNKMPTYSNQSELKNLGAVGGRASNVVAGAFTAGPTIAGQGNYSGGIGSHKDLRGGDVVAGVFAAGPMITGKVGGDSIGTHKDLRGSTDVSAIYTAGPTVTGMTK